MSNARYVQMFVDYGMIDEKHFEWNPNLYNDLCQLFVDLKMGKYNLYGEVSDKCYPEFRMNHEVILKVIKYMYSERKKKGELLIYDPQKFIDEGEYVAERVGSEIFMRRLTPSEQYMKVIKFNMFKYMRQAYNRNQSELRSVENRMQEREYRFFNKCEFE